MIIFNDDMKRRFGGKVYRLALSSGCTCPNRDGKVGCGGCIFCSEGGSGDFAQGSNLSVTEQIERAKALVAKKLSKNFAGYMAYFQSYTSTYGDIERLMAMFEEAIAAEEVIALSVATRPDCVDDEIARRLADLKSKYGKPVFVELGLQTIRDDMARLINRCYETAVYDEAVKLLKSEGLEVITHVIVGLPGETSEDAIKTCDHVAKVGSDGIKLSLLHVMKGTALKSMIDEGIIVCRNDAEGEEDGKPILHEYELDEYLDLIFSILHRLPEDMVVHRMTGDAPKKLLISPEWTSNKRLVINEINRRMRNF